MTMKDLGTTIRVVVIIVPRTQWYLMAMATTWVTLPPTHRVQISRIKVVQRIPLTLLTSQVEVEDRTLVWITA